MDSSFSVENNNSLCTFDSRVQPLLSEISSQLQGFFTAPSAPVQLAQIYEITDLTAQQALIKAGSSKQLEFPSIEVLSDEIMGSTRGAYATPGNKIYLNESLLATDNEDLLSNTLLEEIGHSFDPIFNPGGDSQGDEGELFQNIVNGNILSPSELKRIQRENDWGIINGVLVEQNNTLGTARNLGNLNGTRNFSDFVGTADTNDYYRFTLSGNSNFKLAMTGMTANADVQLLNSAGGVITSSRATGSTAESIVSNLSAGTYYIRTYPVGTANTNYNLSLQAVADNAGNTLATARNLGNLNGIRNFSDFVGAIDTNDYYRFTLNSNSNFSIVIDSMTANADLQLLNSSGGVIESSTTGGLTEEAIFGRFNAGTYYVRVYPVGGANTNYNLNFVAFPGGFGEA